MATQPSQTPAKTSQSSILLSSLNYTSPFESTGNDHGLLASIAASSDIHVPTELQQPHDFQSTAAQADTSRTVNSIDYYKDVDFPYKELKSVSLSLGMKRSIGFFRLLTVVEQGHIGTKKEEPIGDGL
jgi:hypothetical protein